MGRKLEAQGTSYLRGTSERREGGRGSGNSGSMLPSREPPLGEKEVSWERTVSKGEPQAQRRESASRSVGSRGKDEN